MNPLEELRRSLSQGKWCWVTEMDELDYTIIHWFLSGHIGVVKVQRIGIEDWELVARRCIVQCVIQLRKVFGGEQ